MSKQIDINGLAEFKKKCDETYAKVGQGGTSDDIYHIIDLGNTLPWEVEDNTAYNEIKSLLSEETDLFTKPICFKLYGNTYIPVSTNDMCSVFLEGDELGICIKIRVVVGETIFILTPNDPFVIPIQTCSGDFNQMVSIWFNEELQLVDISKPQQLTLMQGLTIDTIISLITDNFIDTYYFYTSMAGLSVVYSIRFVSFITGGLVFNSRISALDSDTGTIKEQVLLLILDKEKNKIEFGTKVIE